MTFAQVAAQLRAVGYALVKNYKCPIRGKIVPLASLPGVYGPNGAENCSGVTCVHNTLEEAARRAEWVATLRSWEAAMQPIGQAST